MTDLSIVEQGLRKLLEFELDTLVRDYKETVQIYNLPTGEDDILKMVILVAKKKLKEIQDLEEIKI
jgi:hypothetical protein